jgi:uncharacterized circularly permuted ATP-grasp superfamily protein
MQFAEYQAEDFFDEMFAAPGIPRPGSRMLVQIIESLNEGELLDRQAAAEQALLHMGITFNVYGDKSDTERIFPIDVTGPPMFWNMSGQNSHQHKLIFIKCIAAA